MRSGEGAAAPGEGEQIECCAAAVCPLVRGKQIDGRDGLADAEAEQGKRRQGICQRRRTQGTGGEGGKAEGGRSKAAQHGSLQGCGGGPTAEKGAAELCREKRAGAAVGQVQQCGERGEHGAKKDGAEAGEQDAVVQQSRRRVGVGQRSYRCG